MTPRAEFDRYEATYEQLVDDAIGFSHRGHAFFLEAKATRLLSLASRRLGPPAALRAVDVGCGPGAMHPFLKAFGNLAAVDVSEPLLMRARAANPHVDYHLGDGRALPFDDAAFDVAFTVGVLHHVPAAERDAFVRELARVTRGGGLVVVFEHNPLNPLTRLAVDRCEFDDRAVLLPCREVRQRLRAAGLRVIEQRYILFFPWRGAAFAAAERALRRVPLGAQYYVAAEPGLPSS